MSRRIVGLPVDARPVVRSQVVQLVACSGWTLRVPETKQLGHLRTPADRDVLQHWLWHEAPGAEGLVLSLDMLLYGGLVPSRFSDEPLGALAPRLAWLRTLKARHPGRPLYAFASTLRISDSDAAEEEKPYWAQYGRLLWRWSYHADRAEQTGEAASARAAEQAAAAIPAAVREDYRATRARNFALVQQALELVREGVIDRLALPQDDTAEYGMNIAERRALQTRVAELGLQARVHICPGADEVLHTLCAHLVGRLDRREPLRVALACSDPAHVGALRAAYEDRPLLQAVAAQLEAVGARLVADEQGVLGGAGGGGGPGGPGGPLGPSGPSDPSGSPPDLLLAVHTQGVEQGDWALARPLPHRPGIDEAWWARLQRAFDAGQSVALADLAFANGGDPLLLAQPRLALSQLFSYAGWNTVSNRLGGLLAHAVLARGRWRVEASRRVLALRLLEDGLYQPVLRAALRGCAGGAAGEAQLPPGALEAMAEALVRPTGEAWLAAHGLAHRVRAVRLPWQRSFEIDIELEPGPGHDSASEGAR